MQIRSGEYSTKYIWELFRQALCLPELCRRLGPATCPCGSNTMSVWMCQIDVITHFCLFLCQKPLFGQYWVYLNTGIQWNSQKSPWVNLKHEPVNFTSMNFNFSIQRSSLNFNSNYHCIPSTYSSLPWFNNQAQNNLPLGWQVSFLTLHYHQGMGPNYNPKLVEMEQQSLNFLQPPSPSIPLNLWFLLEMDLDYLMIWNSHECPSPKTCSCFKRYCCKNW